MRKLKLELDALRVESFEAQGSGPAAQGTVRAREVTLRADTCGCPDTSIKNPCVCTESPTCWHCD